MTETQMDYEKAKEAVRMKNAMGRNTPAMDNGREFLEKEPTNASDVLQVGTKVLIGGGVGLLAGVAVIAVAASAAEVVVAGVVTKIAGVVGGACGLSWGLGKYQKGKAKKAALESGR
jgi:hypothetical protein